VVPVPAERRVLTRSSAEETVHAVLAGDGLELVGAELEWPVHRIGAPSVRADPATLWAACATSLPAGGQATVEPGGQLELATAPVREVDRALDAARTDREALWRRLRRAGLAMSDVALDTRRSPHRVLDVPRYAAMERFFAAGGAAGAWMMCNTASLQLNIGYQPSRAELQWRLAHRLGPVFVAVFANSPGRDASGRRWESLRQAIWHSIDAARTRPVGLHHAMDESWLEYALDADVMMIGASERYPAAPLLPGMTFAKWMAEGHELGWPTGDDLAYHLTTLFPPVRPRGWLELRMLDMLPPRLLEVATLVVVTALAVESASQELWDRLPAADGLWREAARWGLAHPVLAESARALFDVAAQHVGEVTSSRQRREAVLSHAAEFVDRGVAPAQTVGSASLAGRMAPLVLPLDRRTGRNLGPRVPDRPAAAAESGSGGWMAGAAG
jgi:glutamate--cysteine ligase